MMMCAIAENDVLCGRGGATNNHPGNRRFRSIVAGHMPEYLEAPKKEKAIIARRIVNLIKEAGGRFLRRGADMSIWVEVTDTKATAKTAQALREGLDVRHGTYRPEKMARRDSDSTQESPRKKTRLVTGMVIDSPKRRDYSGSGDASLGSIPELNSERDNAYTYTSSSTRPEVDHIDPLMKYFEPPRISKADCEDVAAV